MPDNAGFTNVSKELASIAANHGDISLLKDIIKTNIQSKAIIQSKQYQDVLEKIACAEDTSCFVEQLRSRMYFILLQNHFWPKKRYGQVPMTKLSPLQWCSPGKVKILYKNLWLIVLLIRD